MSMISAQIDELRELATRYDELQVGAVKAFTMPSDMGSILRDAADTIWQLRDDLQRTNDAVLDAEHDESMAWDRVRKAESENAKLREERNHWHVEQVHAFGNWEDAHRRVIELESENAKLRELIDLKQTCWKYVGLCDECPYNGVDDEHDDCNCTVWEKVNSLARELKVEVDG